MVSSADLAMPGKVDLLQRLGAARPPEWAKLDRARQLDLILPG
jgi:hypothetical protein